MNEPTRPRVLLAKPGLDGHDRGVKVVAIALANGGCEVIYTGLRQKASAIAAAARDEAADVVGLSILSGAHILYTQRVLEAMREAGIAGVPLVVGGNIPQRDVAALAELGAARVFRTGSPLDEIVRAVRSLAEQRA